MADIRGTGGLGNTGFSPAKEPAAAASATVRLGETSMAEIAKRLDVNLDALLNANPQVTDPNSLKAGQEIRFPQAHQGAPGHAAAAPALAPASNPAGQLPSTGADPLLASLMQARLNRNTPADAPILRDGGVLYAKDGGSGSTATAKAGPSVAAEVTTLLADGAKVKDAAAEFTAAQNAIAAGDYTKAHAELEKLLRKQGEEVLSEDAVKGTQTVRDQLEFLSGMQKKGIKADYPPTEAQLTEYFKTMSNDPAAARQAFQDYTRQFHVHPANVQGKDFDVQYSKDDNKYGTHVPDNWSEVSNRPTNSKTDHLGKQINDCEGYAFMADKLLGAAGFKVAHHLSAHPGPNNAAHSMVAFTHPKEKGFTVTSNDGVFKGNTEKAAAIEGFKYAAGKVTGEESYYTGKTMAESQIQSAVKEHKLK